MTRQDELIEIYIKVVDGFDGSEYQQGKKDGLRIAIAVLGVNHPLVMSDSLFEDTGFSLADIAGRRIEKPPPV